MIRVELDGEGLAGFDPTESSDAYINAYFPTPERPYPPNFNPATAKKLPAEERPCSRRYTVRAWDATTGVLTLDFVVHGDSGVAGPWAMHAKPGDVLALHRARPAATGPTPRSTGICSSATRAPCPPSRPRWRSLPAGALAYVFIEVDGPETSSRWRPPPSCT